MTFRASRGESERARSSLQKQKKMREGRFSHRKSQVGCFDDDSAEGRFLDNCALPPASTYPVVLNFPFSKPTCAKEKHTHKEKTSPIKVKALAFLPGRIKIRLMMPDELRRSSFFPPPRL